MKLQRVCLTIVFLALGATAGCERSGPAPAAAGAAQPAAAALPAGVFVDAAPAGAVEVSAGRRDAKPGTAIVLHGRIGGRKDPFVDGRAVFTLADMKLPPCSEKEDDHCATPWDYCCEPPEDIAAGTVTVQVADAQGRPLKCALRGVSGLGPLSKVTVAGEVASGGAEGLVIVNARAIHVEAAESGK